MPRLLSRRAALVAIGLPLAYLMHQQLQQQLQPQLVQSSGRQSSARLRPDQISVTPHLPATVAPAGPLFSSTSQQITVLRNTLPQGELLREGEFLVSPHDRFFVAIEGGKAVARTGTPSEPSPGPALWDSSTLGPARPLRRGVHALVVQADGAVAVVNVDTSGQSLVWSSPSASSVRAAAARTHFELRLADDGDSSGGGWSAVVYSVPTASASSRDAPPEPAVDTTRLFSLRLEELSTSGLTQHQVARTSSSVSPSSSPGRACFQNGRRSECVRYRDASLCGDQNTCVAHNLWDAQALCSRRTDCGGVARLPSLSSTDSSPYAHPKYSFVLCKVSAPSMDATDAVDTGHVWTKTSCDADGNSNLLGQINLVLTVKTSGKVHDTRVQSMLRSWGSTPAVRELLYFFTDVHSDTVDRELAVLAGDGDEAAGRQHFINTECPEGHDRTALCCKTDSELRFFLQQMESANSGHPSFWCHFDDDNYVVVSHLVEHLLKEYAEQKAAISGQSAGPVWIGRRGPKPLELGRRSLVDECTAAKQPDDMTIGLVMQRQNVALRHSPQFHSQWEIYNRHLEDTVLWSTEQRRTGEETTTPMSMQITLGWDYWSKKRHDLRRDMLQLHYYLLLEAQMTGEIMGWCFSNERSGFLRGCLSCKDVGTADCTDSTDGCAHYVSLTSAQDTCIATPRCAGVTKDSSGEFTCRVNPTLEPTPSSELTWLKQICHAYGEEDMPPTASKK